MADTDPVEDWGRLLWRGHLTWQSLLARLSKGYAREKTQTQSQQIIAAAKAAETNSAVPAEATGEPIPGAPKSKPSQKGQHLGELTGEYAGAATHYIHLYGYPEKEVSDKDFLQDVIDFAGREELPGSESFDVSSRAAQNLIRKIRGAGPKAKV
jgi:hypothetical protein